MPELPEVTTTVAGLARVLKKLSITDVWSDYHLRTTEKSKRSIKHRPYFNTFKKEVTGETFTSVERRGKHILIHLSHNKTILVHMKMTGHFLYGSYHFDGKHWHATTTGALQDSWNGFIHLTFSLSNGKTLAFSDMRKFAKVILIETDRRHMHADLKSLGPEPLTELSASLLYERIQKSPKKPIKSVLMDQTILVGIGNIYSDEILWLSGIHPERPAGKVSMGETKKLFAAMLDVLKKGIELGGDSMSDYRNINGERGGFQNSHKAYRRTGQKCLRARCPGTIRRKIIGGRSAHFCDTHQTR